MEEGDPLAPKMRPSTSIMLCPETPRPATITVLPSIFISITLQSETSFAVIAHSYCGRKAAPAIQNRTTTFTSGQPFNSK